MNLLLKHLKETRTILVYACITFSLIFFFSLQKFHVLLYILAYPILSLDVTLKNSRDFICTDFYEIVITYFYVALFFSVYLTVLFSIKTVINFCKSGLFRSEILRLKAGFRILTLTVILSDYCTWLFILPLIFSLFLNLEQNLNVITLQLEAKVLDYVNVVFSLIFMFNLMCPVLFFIVLLLTKKSLNLQFLSKNRRRFLLISIVLGCVFSPPDVLIQVAIASLLLAYVEIFFLLSFVKQQYNKFL